METTLLNLEIISLIPEYQQAEYKNRNLLIECKLRMQLCAILSQINRYSSRSRASEQL